MTICYSIISPLKNVVMTRKNIYNFREGEHGIYFIWEGNQVFINWNILGTYTLIGGQNDS